MKQVVIIKYDDLNSPQKLRITGFEHFNGVLNYLDCITTVYRCIT